MATVHLICIVNLPVYAMPYITYCKPFKYRPRPTAAPGRRGLIVVEPKRRSWSAVLTLLIIVVCTSADGIEKSQYRRNVFLRVFSE